MVRRFLNWLSSSTGILRVCALGMSFVVLGMLPVRATQPDIAAQTFLQQAKLFASPVAAADYFGYSVATDNNVAVVGAPLDDPGGVADAGALYVYNRSGDTYVYATTLTVPGAQATDKLGISVAIYGSVIVAGAERISTGGAAFVFERIGSTWQYSTALPADNSQCLGASVAVDNETIIVGAPCTGSGFQLGAAFIYIFENLEWSLQARLDALESGRSQRFGSAVALNGDLAIIGAPLANGTGSIEEGGAAYAFRRTGTFWSLQISLPAGDLAPFDHYGSAVAINNNIAVVGAPDGNPIGVGGTPLPDAGAVYAYVFDGSLWQLKAKLTAWDFEPGDRFGASVDVESSTLVVGAPFEDPGAVNAGSAYVFEGGVTTWAQWGKLTASDRAANDNFGSSVSVFLDTIISGALQADVSGQVNAGAAYAYIEPFPPANTNLIVDGQFATAAALNNWGFWGTTQQVAGGRLEIARTPSSPNGGFFQFVNYVAPTGATFELNLDMGNRSSSAKSINLIVRSSDWLQIDQCAFSVPAFSPMQRYTMRFSIGQAYQPLLLQGWIEPNDGAMALQVDNIDLQYLPGQSVSGTRCTAAPPINVNLIYDGAFNAGFANWGFFGNPWTQINGGVLEMARWRNTGDAGFFQFNPYVAPEFGTFQLNFRVGNRSAAFKTLSLLVRNADWSNNRICYLGIQANTPMRFYQIELRATVPWNNIIIQGFLNPADGLQAVQIDDIDLRYIPGLVVFNNLECPTILPPAPDNPLAFPQPVMPEQIGDGGITPLVPSEPPAEAEAKSE